MELSDSHKISQEKRDFKIIDVLITAWSRVQVLDGPPKKCFCRKVEAFYRMADRDIKATTLPLPMKAIVCGVDCSFLAVMLH